MHTLEGIEKFNEEVTLANEKIIVGGKDIKKSNKKTIYK